MYHIKYVTMNRLIVLLICLYRCKIDLCKIQKISVDMMLMGD